MRTLLFGKNGQVGLEFQKSWTSGRQLFCMGREELDICDSVELRYRIRDIRPDFIVNASAYTAVDDAENNETSAVSVNASALSVMGEEARTINATVFHYSTDYVFGGEGDQAYSETDGPSPINAYGRSKLAGELALANSGARHIILRTSWIFSSHGKNFVKTILKLAQEREELRVVSDQYGAPTSAKLIACTTMELIAASNPIPSGVYHLAAAGVTTWYGFACAILDDAGRKGWPLKVKSGDIIPISSSDYVTAAKRPLNSRLSTRKLGKVLGYDFPDWRSGLSNVIDELGEERKNG
jgi:dTDP-4-dehydrorhamnose reductase